MEVDLTTLLKTLCPRVFPDIAPEGTTVPYVTYQGFGGRPLRALDGTPADKRNTFMQVNAWASTRAQALTLIRSIEDALCSPTAPFIARPQSEPISTAEPELGLYGCIQDFNIWASR